MMPTLVALSGSLRRDSYNTAILTTLADRWRPRAAMTLHDYRDRDLHVLECGYGRMGD